MKKNYLFWTVLALSLGLMAHTAYAGKPLPPAPANDTPYMTLDTSEVAKTTFGWDEKPFCFLWLPALNSTLTLNVQNVWKYGDTVVETQNTSYTGLASLKNWTGLANWDTLRKVGDWTLDTSFGYEGGRFQICTTNGFTVTPEPIGAALFLLGGLAISTRKFFGKKKGANAKTLALFLFLVLGLGMMGQTAYAVVTTNPLPPFPDNDSPYVTLNNSETAKTLFGWSEKPYVFLWIEAVDSGRTLNVDNIWKYGDTVVETQHLTYSGISSLKNWTGLANWDTLRKVGDWSVTTEWGYANSKYKACCNENTFTVTPEPVSAALFLLGGLAISTRKFFIKKP